PRSEYYWGDDNWEPYNIDDNLVWYVFDDRTMYRPGEDVHLKGWLRRMDTGKGGDLELVSNTVETITYQVYGSQGNELFTGTAEVTALGGFDFNFTLPENVNLGYAQIYLTASGSISGVNNRTYYHSFQIQEFRRPEFEVAARNETTAPYFVNDEATVAVSAEYYAGGPLPNADVNWSITSTPTNYSPPNWPGFSFGVWTPWWWYDYYYFGETDSGGSYQNFNARTDAAGEHFLHMTFQNSGEPRPYNVTANVSVTDVNRQAWASATSLLVHPSDLYVGMRTERYFVNRNTPIQVELIVTDLDGEAMPDTPIAVTGSRLEWKYQQGEWQEVEVERQECTVTSQAEPVNCTFETPMGGRYKITATVTDEQGRDNQSSITRWVSGGKQPTAFEVEQETAMLVPDKETYQPGDTAEILVMSPFSPAEGLLTVSRNGVLYTERFVIEEDTTTLLIPIEEAHLPNLNIQVDLVGAAQRTDALGNIVEDVPDRPAYASGSLTLNIPPLARTLALDVTPQDTKLEPGGETTLDVVLKDANGRPVEDAELAVVVVDEAVLALTNYQLTDPISTFYYTRPSNLTSVYSRGSIVLVDPSVLAQDTSSRAPMPTGLPAAGGGGDDAAFAADGAVMEEMEMAAEEPTADMDKSALGTNEDAGSAIAVRTDFNPLAIFSPAVRTDANGTAQVQISLPDNLTRYRIMVVAVDESGKRFGSAESSLTARLPLMIRPSISRFLNFGDKFELPLVVQNQTDEDMTVNLVAQASNLTLTGDIGVQVMVPANDRVEVRFPGTTLSAGTARVQFAGVSGDWTDAAEVSLPVYTPATTEAFATYGVIDDGATLQPMGRPEDVIPIYGGLEITTSSTALQALTDAVLYLVAYPYDCSEQMASRILAIASLRDVLTAFEAEGLPSPEAMEARVEGDIEMLSKLQNYDGGFPYWRRGRESIPFNTVHVALSLQRARMMGFEVPEDMWQNVLNYLRNIEDYYPYWYSERIKQTISAYALYVRLEMDDPDPAKANALLQDAGVEDLSLDALAWIWQVLTRYESDYSSQLAAIRTHVNNQAVETAGAANFTTGYDDDAYLVLHSNRRTDALLLDAMISDNPDSDLIPKLVTGLLAHRTKGRWGNTQENVFVLLALDRYFKTYENVEPDFVARMWLGESYVGASEFQGYSADSYQLDVPMQFLLDSIDSGENQDIILQKDGAGRLYYRLGLRYAPDDLMLDPLDMGFVVQRSYEAIDDPEDVTQDSDGIWHIKAGARVRVRVTMVADNRRYHVALVDPLPAGLEVINPDLAVSETVPEDPNSNETQWYWWWWTWYQHQNMRDERVEAFTTLLWDGVYEYTYETRATMPGTFVVPPAKAEEMYSPEVFGRSSSDIVVIED
ncbi:MAG TPA: alpha-2-macroglobulin family protein, partial [Anaerolineales bacterium]|nr:alpha-2-macroglobulin family protein [Anaerolineales bacterium]